MKHVNPNIKLDKTALKGLEGIVRKVDPCRAQLKGIALHKGRCIVTDGKVLVRSAQRFDVDITSDVIPMENIGIAVAAGLLDYSPGDGNGTPAEWITESAGRIPVASQKCQLPDYESLVPDDGEYDRSAVYTIEAMLAVCKALKALGADRIEFRTNGHLRKPIHLRGWSDVSDIAGEAWIMPVVRTG